MIQIGSKHHELAAQYPYEITLVTSTPTSGVLIFQPRDGTRYVLLFSAISDLEAKVLGHSPGSSLVSVMEGPNQYVTAAFSHAPFYAYAEEKLHVSTSKARQVSRALRFLFTAEDIGVPLHGRGHWPLRGVVTMGDKGVPYWQQRVVVGTEGGAAVRFLGPFRQALVEIPAEEIRKAAIALGYDVREGEAK